MLWLRRTMSSRLQLSSLLSNSEFWIARPLTVLNPFRIPTEEPGVSKRQNLSASFSLLTPLPSVRIAHLSIPPPSSPEQHPPRSMATDHDDKPATPKLKLYSYWRSSCSQRVRIVLNLKGLDYEYKAVNLLKNEQANPEFEELNPIKYVPALVDGDTVIADSFAIIMYLDEKYPQPPLLPHDDLQKKALNIQVASIVGSSIQPLQNIPVLSYIKDKFNSDEVIAWAQHHIGRGFTALEKLLQGCAGRYATGDEVQMADVFLAPQISAGIVRFQVDMSQFPTLARLHEAYAQHPSFQAADPTKQPDATSAA